jgi:hypothetical protein
MKDIIEALEAKRAAGNRTVGETLPRDFAVACIAWATLIVVAAYSPHAAPQEQSTPWASADGRFQIDFSGNAFTEAGLSYAAPEVLVRVANQSGTAGCELSILSVLAPPGSQDRVNLAIRSIADDMSRLESAETPDYSIASREVDSVAVVVSVSRSSNLEGTVARFGRYHDGSVNMYTLACIADAEDSAGITSMHAVIGSIRFESMEAP